MKHIQDKGFTLIELMVVVVFIAIVSGILVPMLLKVYDKARKPDIKIQNLFSQPTKGGQDHGKEGFFICWRKKFLQDNFEKDKVGHPEVPDETDMLIIMLDSGFSKAELTNAFDIPDSSPAYSTMRSLQSLYKKFSFDLFKIQEGDEDEQETLC